VERDLMANRNVSWYHKVLGAIKVMRLRAKGRPKDEAHLRWVWPAVAGRAIGLSVCALGLVALAYETGKPTNTSSAFLQSIITAATKPAVAIPLATMLVLGIGSCGRRLWTERLIRKGGPIMVADLKVPDGIIDVDDVARLSTTFRRRLMQLRLQAPAPVPGAAPAQDFLSMVDSEHLDTKNPFGTVVALVRTTIPTHGFEVSAALTQEPATLPARPRCVVTAQVTRMPNEVIPIETAWAYRWEDAVEKAADLVSSAILPRTCLSNSPPWAGWRRYPMPPNLVHHFEKAEELTTDCRYDEALDHYYSALELDPKSVHVRLHKGFVEEKLALYLDAAATYVAADKIAAETSPQLYDKKARVHREASGRIARYRLAVLLSGDRFAHQWRKPAPSTPRERQRKPENSNRRDKPARETLTLRGQQRKVLRARLVPAFIDLLDQAALIAPNECATREWVGDSPRWGRAHVKELLEESCRLDKGYPVSDEQDYGYYEIRELFGCLALRQFEALREELDGDTLTPVAVQLSIEGLNLRLQFVRQRRAELQFGGEAQPPKVSIERVREILGGERKLTWSDWYSAACLCALPLLVDEVRANTTLRDRYAKAAVGYLREAMSKTISWHAAQQRDWILSEDPDLDGLRRHRDFKTFEAIYFPSPAWTPQRPERVHVWEQSSYTHSLLSQTACRWETIWHQRRAALSPSIDQHVVLQWFEDEPTLGSW
jgi:tetratricopeptide (TPR) repeat protein